MTISTDSLLKNFNLKQESLNLQAALNRARSLTVGTCFNGAVEISMRGSDGKVLWATLNPPEVVEFIHQLTASISCHILIKPRKDFMAYRNWEAETNEEIPLSLFVTKQIFKGHINEQSMAIKKTVKRRSTKRAATTT